MGKVALWPTSLGLDIFKCKMGHNCCPTYLIQDCCEIWCNNRCEGEKFDEDGTQEWVTYLPPLLAQACPEMASITASPASRLQSHCEREVPAATVWTSSPYLLSCLRMTVSFCISLSAHFVPHPHTLSLKPICGNFQASISPPLWQCFGLPISGTPGVVMVRGETRFPGPLNMHMGLLRTYLSGYGPLLITLGGMVLG